MSGRTLPFVLILGLAAGCQSTLSPQGRQLLQTAQVSYEAGDDVATINGTTQFIQDNPRVAEVSDAYYLRGLSQLRQKNSDAAKLDLLEASRTENPVLRPKAYKALGDLAFDAGDMPTAEAFLRQAIAGMDETKPPADQVRYRLGQVLQRQGRWVDADAQFDRLLYFFDGSEFARRAARLIRARAWTVQVGAWRDRKAAETVVAQLKAKGLSAFVADVLADGSPVFAAQVGRQGNYDQAMAAIGDVKAKGGTPAKDAFVTVTR